MPSCTSTRSHKWDLAFRQRLPGWLVAITCPCTGCVPVRLDHDRGHRGIVVVRHRLLERRRWDDPIGAVAVHFFCGIWGTLSSGPSPPEVRPPTPLERHDHGGDRAVYGNHPWNQLKAQIIGSGDASSSSAACLIMFWLIKQIRVPGTYGSRRKATRGPRHPRTRHARYHMELATA